MLLRISGTDFSCQSQPGHYYFLAEGSYNTLLEASSRTSADSQCVKAGGESIPLGDALPDACLPGLKVYLADYGFDASKIIDVVANVGTTQAWPKPTNIICRRKYFLFPALG